MSKFHINTAGEAGQCRAENGKCPFGGESDHFTSADAAREAYESKQESFSSPAQTIKDYVVSAVKAHRSNFGPKTGAAEPESLYEELDDSIVEVFPKSSAVVRNLVREKLLVQLGQPKNYGDDNNPAWAWPTAKDREAAVLEAANEARATHGDSSAHFRQWGKIHSDFKTVDQHGRKLVMVFKPGSGTVLEPWYGPKVLDTIKPNS